MDLSLETQPKSPAGRLTASRNPMMFPVADVIQSHIETPNIGMMVNEIGACILDSIA
jgi:hypothetical protein